VEPAEYPQRQCRQPVSEDGLIDHFCNLPELHPGPCAPSSSPAALERRKTWEEANPGWEKMISSHDPFADFTIPGEQR
jgi:hypothetical protein